MSMNKWNPAFHDAFVSTEAQLGTGVEIGPGAVVHRGVSLGERVSIGANCLIGEASRGLVGETIIGAEAKVRSHTVIYAGSTFGRALETGHHVVIRDGTRAGENLRVGNFSDIEGECVIGDYCRFHGYVHVGRGSTIGNFVWLYSLSIATNDPLPPSAIHDPVTIEDGAVVCVGAVLMPGTRLGVGAFVCAGATAAGDVPAAAVVAGSRGRVVNHVKRLVHMGEGLQHPWMSHFRRGFPEEASERLELLRQQILASPVHVEGPGDEA
jgi:UDP-3-O-[3-hydroxymyristoyl] glucosamine N-acyltransferase